MLELSDKEHKTHISYVLRNIRHNLKHDKRRDYKLNLWDLKNNQIKFLEMKKSNKNENNIIKWKSCNTNENTT